MAIKCLVWGGPAHGQVIAIRDDRPVWEVPLAPRLSYRSLEDIGPEASRIGTVRYEVEKFGWRGPGAPQGLIWRVLIGGDDRERLIRRLEGVMNFIGWLSRGLGPCLLASVSNRAGSDD